MSKVSEPTTKQMPSADTGRLTTRPVSAPTGKPLATGLHRLGLDTDRDALLYVPQGLPDGRPVPLVVMLHGAGGEAQHGITPLQEIADTKHFLLLAPPSRGRTWDIIVRERYGPDIAFLDAALKNVFDHFPVDAERVAVAGFSDGASYALSVGLMNGDLFRHVLAFSPGFMAPRQHAGKPEFYVAHGTLDMVLNIDRCSRRIVPRLKSAGYEVRYREFLGPHILPQKIARDGIDGFLGGKAL
jgi:phospholipase/carboxylesterase